MRTTAALEGPFLVSVARWCCAALLVAAFTVIVADMMTICLNVDSAAATTGQSGVPQEGLSRPPGTGLSNEMIVSTSELNLSVPDTNGFGIRKALNAGSLKDNANQPVFTTWLGVDSHQQIPHRPVTGAPLAAWIVPKRSY